MTPLRLTVYETWSRDVVSAWAALAAADPDATVFSSPAWLRAWWDTLGHGRLALVALHRDDRLVAVFPLAEQGGELGFLGGEDVTDELVWSAASGLEDEALRLLVAWAGRAPLRFGPLRAGSRWNAALERLAGAEVVSEALDVAPAIDLPPTWGDYLAGLSGHDRQELLRKRRRLDHAAAWAVRRVVAEEREHALDAFIAQHRATPGEKGAFFTPGRQRFFRRLAADLDGQARLDVLELDGEPVAWTFAYDHRGELALYNSTFRRDQAALSPGMVLVGCLIERAIAEGKRRFDFLRGAEAYKRRFGVTAHPLRRARVQVVAA